MLGSSNPFGVILATIVGIPMYADIFGTIPVAEALLSKGAQLGTVLSFMTVSYTHLDVYKRQVRHYNLKVNPAAQVGNMGKAKGREMLFWTKAEYLKFAEAMMDKPLSYYAFEMLYWCGVREGELLAPVSYTHLDVYKRQGEGEQHPPV